MPRIKNKVTGKVQTVTDDELKAIQANEMTKDLYESKTEEPEEVTGLKKGAKTTEKSDGGPDKQ